MLDFGCGRCWISAAEDVLKFSTEDPKDLSVIGFQRPLCCCVGPPVPSARTCHRDGRQKGKETVSTAMENSRKAIVVNTFSTLKYHELQLEDELYLRRGSSVVAPS